MKYTIETTDKGCIETLEVSKVIVESLVDPKSYANQLCRRIKKDFCIK